MHCNLRCIHASPHIHAEKNAIIEEALHVQLGKFKHIRELCNRTLRTMWLMRISLEFRQTIAFVYSLSSL